jgi:sugar phosphate isomerase/epimerase
MSARIALQLYSVREALAQDFAGVVKKIADMGYVGVETAGFPGTTPLAAGQLLKDLGLLVVAAHAPLPLGEKKQEVIETMQAIHCPRIVCASRPAEGFATPDGIQQVCETLNEAHAVARASGLAFGYHNHTAEFQMVGERNAFDIFVERLDPGIFLEVDTYWVQAAGINPATVVRKLGPRAPLLHVKDGPCVRGKPQVALGEGAMDIPSILQAGAGFTEWVIVELDQCATDMLAAVEKSCRYLMQH